MDRHLNTHMHSRIQNPHAGYTQNNHLSQAASTVIQPQSSYLQNVRGPPNDSYPFQFQRRSSFSMEDATDGGSFTRYNLRSDEIELYRKRLSTYEGTWPQYAAVTQESVAKAGMSYIGPDDKVQCDYCRGILYSFESGDIPLDEHRRHFPLCQYLELRRWETLETQLEAESERNQIQSEIELSEKFQTVNPSMDCQEVNQVTDMTKHPVFEIVTQFGYDDEMVKIAFNQVLAEKSINEINTGDVLDRIFQLESW